MDDEDLDWDAYDKPYSSEKLQEACLIRKALKDRVRKDPSAENLKLYRKQRNYCSRLYKKERSAYYSVLHAEDDAYVIKTLLEDLVRTVCHIEVRYIKDLQAKWLYILIHKIWSLSTNLE